MDPEIEDLKEKVEALLKVSQDTNKQVHKMRRAARWNSVLQLLFWIVFFVASGAAYFYWVSPYISSIEQAYGNAQNFESQVQHFFNQFSASQGTSTPQH